MTLRHFFLIKHHLASVIASFTLLPFLNRDHVLIQGKALKQPHGNKDTWKNPSGTSCVTESLELNFRWCGMWAHGARERERCSEGSI